MIHQSDSFHLSVLSNLSFDPHLVPQVMKQFSASGVCPVVSIIPYEEYHLEESLKAFTQADMIAVWLDFEVLFPDLFNTILVQPGTRQHVVEEAVALCHRCYAALRSHSSARILWFLFGDFDQKLSAVTGCRYDGLIDSINLEISSAATEGVTWISLRQIIAQTGIDRAYDPKGRYRWNAPYSSALVEQAVREIHKQYRIETGCTKKCLVLDCDNVLWGGVLSEDGIEQVKLGGGFGRAFQDFQRFVLSLILPWRDPCRLQ